MRLLSLLPRKTGGKGKPEASSTADPRDSTAAGSRPIQREERYKAGVRRTGGYPMDPGTLPRGRPEFGPSRAPPDVASTGDLAAPAPEVPRYREESPERPSTAPNGYQSSIGLANNGQRLQKRGKRGPPPPSSRITRPGAAAPRSRASSPASQHTITSTSRPPCDYSRASSVLGEGAKGFKDILDAQSEIKPADFRARVRATGARDYGEDVAERNMGENGFDLASNHVRQFYSQSASQAPSDENRESPAELGSTTAVCHATVGRRPFRSSSQQALPSYKLPESAFPSGLVSPNPSRVARRRSVNTYLPSASQDEWKISSIDRNPSSLEYVSTRIPTEIIEDFGVSGLGLSSGAVPQPSKTEPGAATRSAKLRRNSVLLAREKEGTQAAEDAAGDDFPPNNVPRPASRRFSALSSAASLRPKHYSLHTLHSSVSSSASRDTVINATALSYPRIFRPHQLHQGASASSSANLDAVFPEDDPGPDSPGSAPAACPKTTSTPPDDLDENAAAHRPPSWCFPPVPAKIDNNAAATTVPDDISEHHSPFCTRSIRGWSASSSTPTAPGSTTTASTTTSSSSHRFQRPPSLHTADTSLDLSLSAASPLPKASRSRLGSVDADADADGGASHDEKADDNENENENDDPPHGLEGPDTDAFNIDDYISSDADSFTTTPDHRPTAAGEEDLLFKDTGFGAGGLQLPGLADPFPSSGPRDRAAALSGASSSSSSSSPPPGIARSLYSGHCYGGCGLRGVLDELDEEEGEDEGLGLACWGGQQRGGGDGMVGGGCFLGRGVVGGPRGGSQSEKAVRRQRRFVLDTAADEDEHDDDDDESGRSAVGDIIFAVGDDDGQQTDGCSYEAGAAAENEDAVWMLGWHRRPRRTRTRRFSALCRVDNTAEQGPEGNRRDCERQTLSVQQQQQQQQKEMKRIGEERQAKADVAAAVRLRKQVKRARRLAGQTSVLSFRREVPASQKTRTRRASLPVPVLRVEGVV